jgi:hypothetical protein
MIPENPIPEPPATHVVVRQPVDNDRNCTLRKLMRQRADRLLFKKRLHLHLCAPSQAMDLSLKSPQEKRNPRGAAWKAAAEWNSAFTGLHKGCHTLQRWDML